MSKQVYISADYDDNGDRDVVEELVKWGKDEKHKVDFIDMSNPSSGSVANSDDCRICDLKAEFNSQINASSAVIFIVGDKMKDRIAGSGCERNTKECWQCTCTPYKKNKYGARKCKVHSTSTPDADGDVGNINSYSYLRHEFEQAKKKGKQIIIFYNSSIRKPSWLPSYMYGYENDVQPFWKYVNGKIVGDYEYIKEVLGF